LTNIKNNKIIISEIEIKKSSPVFNKKIVDIKIPKNCLLVSIIKNEEVFKPADNLVLLEGDSVIVISDFENKKFLRDIFVGKRA
jgi:trk system potassium uptake protein TrkA